MGLHSRTRLNLYGACSNGYVLITVMVTIVLLAAISLMLSRESAMAVNRVGSGVQQSAARYIAEAGVAHAKWSSSDSACANYSLPVTSFAGGSYSGTIVPDNGSPVDISVKAQFGNDTEHLMVAKRQTVYDGIQTLILQPDATDGKDTYLSELTALSNYGADTKLVVDGTPLNRNRSMLQFDLTALASNHHIISASLELYSTSALWPASELDVYAMSALWQEGNLVATLGAASWTERLPGVSWTSAGGDFDAGRVATTQTTGSTGWVSWNLRNLVADWVAGRRTNMGLMIRTAQTGQGAEFASSDHTNATLRPRLVIRYGCECGQVCTPAVTTDTGTTGLVISTLADVSGSTAPGLANWSESDLIDVTNPNLAFEPGTTGATLVSVFSLDNFASDFDSDIDAVHFVSKDIIVGDSDQVALQKGDLLLSTTESESFSSLNTLSVNAEDVFVFRPVGPGNYSSGTFIFLLDGSQIHSNNTVGISLVESVTTVGDRTVQAGSFLMAISNRRDVLEFVTDNVGENTTSGVLYELVDGQDMNFGSEIRGLDLVETLYDVGGHLVPAGSILVSLNNDGSVVGNNNVAVDSEDIFYLTVSQTGANSIASATLWLDGSDLNLTSDAEHIQALSLTFLTNEGQPPVSCDASFLPMGKSGEFSWDSGATVNPRGMAFIAPGIDFNQITAPLGGAWLVTDHDANTIDMYSEAGYLISRKSMSYTGLSGITYIVSGTLGNRYAVTDSNAQTIYILDTLGNQFSERPTGGFSQEPLGISYISDSVSGTYDKSLLVSSRKNELGVAVSEVLVVKQQGTLTTRYDVSGAISDPVGVAHIPNSDKFLVLGSSGVVAEFDLNGNFIQSYDATGYGAPGFQGLGVNLLNCEHALIEHGDDKVVYLSRFGSGTGGPRYLDQFNQQNCNADDYSGSDGLYDWSAFSWTEPFESDDSCAGNITIRTDASIPDGASFRLKMEGATPRIQRRVDTSFMQSASIKFDYRASGFSLGDVLWVLASNDGTNWYPVWQREGPMAMGGYQTMVADITGFIASTTHIAIEVNAGGVFNDIYIDNVTVFDHLNAPPFTNTALDQFNLAGDFSGNDGSLLWDGDWEEVGENDGADAGDIIVMSGPGGSVALRLRDNDNGGEGVERRIDLTGFNRASLFVSYQREALDTNGDYVTVEVSGDDGNSWFELGRISGPGDDTAGIARRLAFDITPFISDKTWIRFKTSPTMGNQDAVWLDDIEIGVSN